MAISVGVAVLLLRQPPHQPPLDGSRASVATGGADDGGSAAAAALLPELGRRLEHGTLAQVTALAADRPARRELATLARNVRTLGVTDLSMRYVAADPTRPTAAQRAAVPDAWVAQVQVRWRIHGTDQGPASVRLPLTLSGGSHGGVSAPVRFVTVRRAPAGDHPVAEPLWLLGAVSVARTSRSLVVTSGGHPAAAYSPLADRAVADVRRVLPHWTGRLVVEVPGDRGGLARVLGSAPSDYDRIAAVTTTEDGSARVRAPVHIVVNARVFDPLGPHASQIVMSHEAAHVATGAAVSRMPTWLLEGFADYVALDHVDLPVTVAASQILARVRAHGAPAHLPDGSDFDATHSGIGASYESAWLACRLLGRTYGERRLVRLYRVVDEGASVGDAMRTVLGTDQARFTSAWRDDLRRLAAR